MCWLFCSIYLGVFVFFQSQAISSRNLSTYSDRQLVCPVYFVISQCPFTSRPGIPFSFLLKWTFVPVSHAFILTSFLPTLRRTSCNETVDCKSLSSLSIVFQLLGCCWEMQTFWFLILCPWAPPITFWSVTRIFKKSFVFKKKIMMMCLKGAY